MVGLEPWETGRVDGGLEGKDEDEEEGELSVSERESSASPCFTSAFVSPPTIPSDAWGGSALRIVLSASGSFLG